MDQLVFRCNNRKIRNEGRTVLTFKGNEVAKEVSAEERNNVDPQISARVEITGPIPSPRILEQYNRILPSAADRIISMAERKQEHGHEMQGKLVDSQILVRLLCPSVETVHQDCLLRF